MNNDLFIVVLRVILVAYVWRSHRETLDAIAILESRVATIEEALRRLLANRDTTSR